MKRYLAVYLGTGSAVEAFGWNALSDDERSRREAAGMEAWGNWMTEHAGCIVDAGGPLGTTKRVGRDGISDVRNDLTGYVILEAESHEAAARKFLDHPHFAIFPGESVEIMECLPIPGAEAM